MIIRTRVDEPFTLPRTIKPLIIKNLDNIRPYFNKNIITVERRSQCNMTYISLSKNPKLKILADEIDSLIKNVPFEAYCAIRTEHPDSIKEKGIKLLTPFTYTSKICKYISDAGFSTQDIAKAKMIISQSTPDQYTIPFFMPYNMEYSSYPECIYFGGSLSIELFRHTMPHVLDLLKDRMPLVLVKCIIRYSGFSETDKAKFIVQLIKHYGYELLDGCSYPISLKGKSVKPITGNRIIETHIL